MTTRNRYHHLLSPIALGRQEIRNRVLVTAHEIKLSADGLPGEDYVAYQAARAEGGVGLQVTGSAGVHRTGCLPSAASLNLLDDRVVPALRTLASAVHGAGGRMLAQLGHGAATFDSRTPGAPSWAPSATPGDLSHHVPHVMTRAEIAEIVDAYGAAAARVRAGALAGVELLAAFGFLPIAFASPLTNRRDDDYGGSFENRLRFMLETLEAIRGSLGDEAILGVRIPGDEQVEGGLDHAAMRDVARALEASGRVDFLNVIAGTNQSRIERAGHWPPTPARHGLFVALAHGIKSVTALPVFTAGRITDPDEAETLLASGVADMVGMTRAHIADPDLVRKLKTGRAAEIRRCVGANVCIRNSYEGRPVSCIYNPEASRERSWRTLAAARAPRRIAVIGGGPAGMEAARVLALRGHRVELYERADTLGGQVRLWARVPAMAEIGRAVEWQAAALERLQVKVHLSHAFDLETASATRPDAIVMASGASAWCPRVEGADASPIRIASPMEVLAELPGPPLHAVVWDQRGGGAGVYTADALSARGCKVSVVAPHDSVAESLTVTLRVPLYQRLLAAGARLIAQHEVIGIDGDAVDVRNIYSRSRDRIAHVDLLVPWHGNRAAPALGQALREAGFELHEIGDALAPREMDIAVAEGATIGRGL